jgi:murein L,D-transpeptidase YcbB/YkuD
MPKVNGHIRGLIFFLASASPIVAAPAPLAAREGEEAFRLHAGMAEQLAVDDYYNHWQGPQWFGEDGRPASELVLILRRSPLDGLATGPQLASRVEQAVQSARSGTAADIAMAERLLSAAWVTYVKTIRQPARDVIYAYPGLKPKSEDATEILAKATLAPSLADYLVEVSSPNPIYAALRDAAWREWQLTGAPVPDPRIVANLERVRTLPATGRFVLVNIATQQLQLYENGRPVDSMKVIVGSPEFPTPMIASVIYYATLNPYWNVPSHLVRKTVAPNVLKYGLSYLKSRGYQAMSDWSEDARIVPPDQVDWDRVASGAVAIRIRQIPGPGNSMGQIKFPFENGRDIYLHDTPAKDLFARTNRYLSNGCVRLEDAVRLGRWLLGREPITESTQPEQFVLLPQGVPIYLTYLTAYTHEGRVAYVADVYGLDPPRHAETAVSSVN